MSELTKRAIKYYFIQGLKGAGYIVILYLVLFAEWLLFGIDDDQGGIHYAIRMIISWAGWSVILTNMMFAVYGPNWYDSMVLSMGARRKDIFLGEIIKQITYVLANFLIILALAFIGNQMMYVKNVLLYTFAAIVVGPLGLIIGHIIKRYGRIAVFTVIFIGIATGSFVGLTVFVRPFSTNITTNIWGVIIVAGTVLYVILELGAYKLNQKSMVR